MSSRPVDREVGSPIADRNARLCLLYHITLHSPLYWPYMFYYVTAVHGLSAVEFGALKSIYYVSVLLLELPLGVVADRLGRRGVLALGAASSTLGCLLYWKSSTFAGFAIAEVANALTSALESGAVSALLYDSYAAERRTAEYAQAESRQRAGGLAAATLALLIADALLAATDDPGWAYAVTGALGLVGVAAALGLREPPRERSQSSRRIAAEAIADLWRAPGLAALVLYSGTVFVGVRAANALVFNPVMAAAELPPTTYGTISAATTLLAAGCAISAARVLERLGLRATLVALPLGVALLFAAAAAWTGPVTAIGLCLHGVAIGVLPTVLAVAINHRIASSDRRATVLSFESMASRGIYGAAIVPLGWALDSYALSTVLYLLAAITAATAIAGAVAARAATPTSPTTPPVASA